MILRSRIVAPLIRPPIEDGVVCTSGERISWVGRRKEMPATLREETEVDLGEAVLMPGLVNAHCHLDYTGMAGQIPPPKSFVDWIKSLVTLKGCWSVDEFASSWRRGAEMLVRSGTTTVADVEAVPELLPSAWQSTPLRVISFRELINVRTRQSPAELVERAVNDWLGSTEASGRVGLSPHAPYTTSTDLLEHAARAAQRRNWRLTTHVAESEQEFEMFMYRQGALFEWLKSQRDVSDCGRGSPVQHLERCGYLSDHLLAVHVNYLWRHDAGILGRSGVSVVHCPRSHEYFHHLRFAFEELSDAGVNICLGTDSLATVRADRGEKIELDMFAEMAAFAARQVNVAPEQIVRMATVNGARALGRQHEIGLLQPGALADAMAIPYSGEAGDAYEVIVNHGGPVASSMIGGRWALAPAGAVSEGPQETC